VVEHTLGKGEVESSILSRSTRKINNLKMTRSGHWIATGLHQFVERGARILEVSRIVAGINPGDPFKRVPKLLADFIHRPPPAPHPPRLQAPPLACGSHIHIYDPAVPLATAANRPRAATSPLPDGTMLLDQVLEWVPDAAQRRQILIENALYGFA
jgi:hypothetical protein